LLLPLRIERDIVAKDAKSLLELATSPLIVAFMILSYAFSSDNIKRKELNMEVSLLSDAL
jgi:hypothetical protein